MNSSGKMTRSAPCRGRGRARAAHLFGVAGDVADGRIELRERDGEAVGGAGVHDMDVARRVAPPQCGQISPSHSANASSQVKPAIASADADRGRAHVLDAADVGMLRRRDVIGQLLDRGVEQLDRHQQQDHADQRQPLPGFGGDQEGERHARARARPAPRGTPASDFAAAISPRQELSVARHMRNTTVLPTNTGAAMTAPVPTIIGQTTGVTASRCACRRRRHWS